MLLFAGVVGGLFLCSLRFWVFSFAWWFLLVFGVFPEFGSCPNERHRSDCSNVVGDAHLSEWFLPDEDVVSYP